MFKNIYNLLDTLTKYKYHLVYLCSMNHIIYVILDKVI